MVVLFYEDANFLCKPSLQTIESTGGYNVAVSRARDRLFINIPNVVIVEYY